MSIAPGKCIWSGLDEEIRNPIILKLQQNLIPENIKILLRKFAGPNGAHRYKLDFVDGISNSNTDNYQKPITLFKEEYLQLSKETKKGSNYHIYLIEIIIEYKKIMVSAGYNWLIIGELENGNRYCAVLYVIIKDMYKGFGFNHILKEEEIKLARINKCNFIQTYHRTNNLYFVPAIIPSLRKGFVLFHGEDDKEVYEDKGFIHLRKYFMESDIHKFKVRFKDGTEFLSPDKNREIISYLKAFKDNDKYPGKQIVKIWTSK